MNKIDWESRKLSILKEMEKQTQNLIGDEDWVYELHQIRRAVQQYTK